jgi:hypothetical protein
MKKFIFGLFLCCLMCGVGCVSAVDIPYNHLHYSIPTSPLLDLKDPHTGNYTGNYTSRGDSISFTAYFYNEKGGDPTLTKTVNVTSTKHETEEGYITAPTNTGYLVIVLGTGVYDRSGTRWAYIEQKCPGTTIDGSERAFWFDPEHPINSTFVFSKEKKEGRFDGIEHFKLSIDKVTVETFPKKS